MNNGLRLPRNRRPRRFYGDSQVTPPRPPVSTTIIRRRDSARIASQLLINDADNEMEIENDVHSQGENILSQDFIEALSQNQEW